MTNLVWKERNLNLAGVRGWINKIKRCGASTFISDGLGRDRIGPACCFAASACIMFTGSLCCNIRVVLAQALTPAPVLKGRTPLFPTHDVARVLTTLKLEA